MAYQYEFHNFQELLSLCKKYRLPISQIVVKREMEIFCKSRPQVRYKMKMVRDSMFEAIQIGKKNTEKSKYCGVGGDAAKVNEEKKKGRKYLNSKTVFRAMAYALATNEQNALMGSIVAFPTAGAAGVIPGVLFSTAKHMKSSKRKLLRGLFTAAAVGIAALEQGSSLAGAKAGCQAEIGNAAAMAAAGVTEMRGGTPEECINAAAIALKQFLGLVCDPIGGRVEVPCVKRNAIAASVAISASDLSLMGVNSFVPMDEVVMAAINIAEQMPYTLRETSLGGLAVTPTGLKVREKMGLKPIPKKYIPKKYTKRLSAIKAIKCEGCNGCG